MSTRLELLDALVGHALTPDANDRSTSLARAAAVAARSLEDVALRSSASTEDLVLAVRAGTDDDDLVLVLTAAVDGDTDLLAFALQEVRDSWDATLRLATLAAGSAEALEEVTGVAAASWVQEWTSGTAAKG